MTTSPINPSSNFPSENIKKEAEKDNKVQESANKVGKLVKKEADVVPTKAPPPHGSAAPATSTAAHGVASAKQQTLIDRLMMLPNEMRLKIVENLPERDLKALEIALGKKHGLQFVKLTEAVFKTIQKKILADHPEWQKQIGAWQGVSSKDAVWLLRVCELYELDIPSLELPELAKLTSTSAKSQFERIPELLQHRKSIEDSLAKVTLFSKNNGNLKKGIDAICLLPNLKFLFLNNNSLTKVPDLSQNHKLERILLQGNKITEFPDISYHKKLKKLDLSDNKIAVLPQDMSAYEHLELNIERNPVHVPKKKIPEKTTTILDTTPLDLRHNVRLEELDIDSTILTTPPDLSRNVRLEEIFLGPHVPPVINLKRANK